MQYPELSVHEEQIGKAIVNAAYKIHTSLGPGLLEKIYEICMAHELRKAGHDVQRQDGNQCNGHEGTKTRS